MGRGTPMANQLPRAWYTTSDRSDRHLHPNLIEAAIVCRAARRLARRSPSPAVMPRVCPRVARRGPGCVPLRKSHTHHVFSCFLKMRPSELAVNRVARTPRHPNSDFRQRACDCEFFPCSLKMVINRRACIFFRCFFNIIGAQESRESGFYNCSRRRERQCPQKSKNI